MLEQAKFMQRNGSFHLPYIYQNVKKIGEVAMKMWAKIFKLQVKVNKTFKVSKKSQQKILLMWIQ